jgi:hypothetical protein
LSHCIGCGPARRTKHPNLNSNNIKTVRTHNQSEPRMNQQPETLRDISRRAGDTGTEFPKRSTSAHGTDVVEAVTAGYFRWKCFFRWEVAPNNNRRSDSSIPPEGLISATSPQSAVGRPCASGNHRSPAVRRRVIYGHDQLMFMKSQLG